VHDFSAEVQNDLREVRTSPPPQNPAMSSSWFYLIELKAF
jgi:hypothetical protein